MSKIDDEITHNQCSVRGCVHCHCHWCHTAALTSLKRLEQEKIDLDALLALYKDQGEELEESRLVARVLFEELRAVASLRCGVDWEQETLAKYPWLKEEE